MSEPTILTMGLGEVVVGHAVHEGMPCIVFAPVAQPGPVGGDATGVIPSDHLPDDAVCLRFSSMGSVLAHLERVKSMIVTFEQFVKDRKPEEAP